MAGGRLGEIQEMRRLFNEQRLTQLQQKYGERDLSDPRIPASVWLSLNGDVAAERERLESLFERYQQHLFKERSKDQDECESIIKRFLGRFHNQEDRHHLAAYYELEIFGLLKELGLDFSIEPAVLGSNVTPDFEIHDPRTYIEVATVFDKENFEEIKKAYDLIRHEVNQIEHDQLRVGLYVKSVPSQLTDEHLAQVREHTRQFLAAAERGEIEIGEERIFGKPGALHLSLKLVTRDAGRRGPIVWLGPHLSFWASAEQAKRAIHKKIGEGIKERRYEFLDRLSTGYIIAIGIGGITFTEYDIQEMLSEEEKLFDKPAMRRISGVLTVSASWEYRARTRSCRFMLIINPNAQIPLGSGLISKLKDAGVEIIKT